MKKTKESLEKLVNQVVFFFISGFSPGVIIRLRGQIKLDFFWVVSLFLTFFDSRSTLPSRLGQLESTPSKSVGIVIFEVAAQVSR